jgi:thioesterase domain-containing protein
MARVAYGHPGAVQRDFVDAWLAEEGHALLALSYPSDHPAFPISRPDLSILEWASSIAELIREYVNANPSRDIVVLGWSLAGRAVVAIERALRSQGLAQLCFVSLAATAPLPNLLPAPAAQERFTPEGFWDSSTRHRQWLQQLKYQVGATGQPAINAKMYLAHYVVNSPFSLRAQPQGTDAGAASACLADEIGAFAYADYPPLAAIIPEDVEDRLHALTDRATWGALNVLRIVRELGDCRGATATEWAALRDLIDQAPKRLSRTICGGHFFFIGEAGAMATVRKIVELIREVRLLHQELVALVEPSEYSTC